MAPPISVHAVQRYRERVKPALDPAQCKAELEALLAMAEESERPDWAGGEARPGARYRLLADGIVAALVGGRVATVMTRGSMGEAMRRERNRYKARRRRAKRTAGSKRAALGSRPRSEDWA
jgi:hypothetical protein